MVFGKYIKMDGVMMFKVKDIMFYMKDKIFFYVDGEIMGIILFCFGLSFLFLRIKI